MSTDLTRLAYEHALMILQTFLIDVSLIYEHVGKHEAFCDILMDQVAEETWGAGTYLKLETIVKTE